MKYNKFLTLSAAAATTVMAIVAMPASATLMSRAATLKLNANASSSITSALDVAARTKADAQINARIAALTALQTRINQMVKVSADQKASLNASIQSSIADMNTLKAKIDADTDPATLKADIQSITKSYRIYILVMPQGRITAASDRVMTIVSLFNDLSVNLQARITAAGAAGQNITTVSASLSDMNAKIADANMQAQAAIQEVMNLQPDNGDQTVMASNQAALKDARAKIKVATTDLKTARQDAGNIVKTLASFKLSATASASTTPQ